jgi:hypothetical protein
MNKPWIFTTCAQLMCAGLILTGCSKGIDGGSPTITIKGRIMRDCSGAPVAGMTLDFYVVSDNATAGGKSGIIGHTTTDADGNFSMTGANYGDGTLSVYQNFNDSRAYRFVYNYPISVVGGSEITLGDIYYQYRTSLAVRFSRAANKPTDTLYFGEFRNRTIGYAVGQAIDGFTYYSAYDLNGEQLPYAEEKKWVWGIGMADYAKAAAILDEMKNDNNPQYYHLIRVTPGVCNDDTAFVRL